MALAPPYILAHTFADAHAFAQEELDLAKGQYRVVNSASTLKAVRNVDLYLVPGWEKRYDRFALKGAIRWTRMRVVDVEEMRANKTRVIVTAVPDDAEPPQSHKDLVARVLPDGLTPPGTQPSLLAPEDEPTPEPAEPAEQAEESAKRRRRRCPECGILVAPADVQTHLAAHEQSEG